MSSMNKSLLYSCESTSTDLSDIVRQFKPAELKNPWKENWSICFIFMPCELVSRVECGMDIATMRAYILHPVPYRSSSQASACRKRLASRMSQKLERRMQRSLHNWDRKQRTGET